MKFMTTHLNQTEQEIKRQFYEIASHWYVGDDKMPYARRPNKYNRKSTVDRYYRYKK